jgi:UDP-N-acetylglucosamine--N-acetylmuramyl-(pentapeptide) pyrophosphoryl-undecaprenol N-acetylglucosamine transferase
MRILLAGGGTLGSVTPLLAVVEELRQKGENQFLWIGTRKGPERLLVEKWGLSFSSIYAGKLRRYFSFKNFIDIFLVLLGFLQAIYFLKKFKPDRVLTAGSFVAVPVVWAARIFKIPILVHQQDLQWGLANKLMRPLATWITVNFDYILQRLPRRYRRRAYLIGNPVRQQIKQVLEEKKDQELLYKKFNLLEGIPVVLVLGGGTGALRLNELVAEAMPELYRFCQVIHLTGKDKRVKIPEGEWERYYHWQELLIEEMADVYRVAEIVVSRAGIGTLSELSILGKPTIIIPLPQSHQEINAQFFGENQAAIVLKQEELTPHLLAQAIRELLFDKNKQITLSIQIKKLANPEAAKEIVELIS